MIGRHHPSSLYAGVELGGTKCICTLATGPDHIVEQSTIPTESPEQTLSAIIAVLTRWWQQWGFNALGVASFGPIDLNPRSASYGRILATNKQRWSGTDVRGRIAASFPVPVGFDTDVNGAALAERHWGCAIGLDDFAYVTVGTGIGVGLLVHGAPTRGIGHSEIGHLRVPRLPGDAAPSACRFHDDCVEGLASGTAVRQRFGDRPIDRATADDPIWNPVVDALATMCHALVCATGPMRIAIGGGVVSRQPHLLDRIEIALQRSLNGYMELPDGGRYIVAPKLGDLAGPLGAIAIAIGADASVQTTQSDQAATDRRRDAG